MKYRVYYEKVTELDYMVGYCVLDDHDISDNDLWTLMLEQYPDLYEQLDTQYITNIVKIR